MALTACNRRHILLLASCLVATGLLKVQPKRTVDREWLFFLLIRADPLDRRGELRPAREALHWAAYGTYSALHRIGLPVDFDDEPGQQHRPQPLST